MSTQPVVPYTPILRRYHEVIATHDEQRYKLAAQLAQDPGPLVADFAESIALLADRYDSEAPFHPTPRTPRPPRQSGISNGTDLAWYLHRQQRLSVADDDGLSVDWVEFELSMLSTRGGAVFDGPVHGAKPGAPPAKAGGPIKADLVLANADPADRTPTLGEVKVRRDKEPFAALVQLLAYIAHLSTPSQYARLLHHLPHAGFAATDTPRFDGYLLLFEFGKSPSTWLPKLAEQSRLTSAALVGHAEVARHVRRLVCLDLALVEGAAEVTATARWRHDAP